MGAVVYGLFIVFALAGWYSAKQVEKKYGAKAWDWPHWAWGLVCGLSLLLGAILQAVAIRQLKKAPVASGHGYGLELLPTAPVRQAAQAFPALEQAVAAPVVPVPAGPVVQASPQVPAGWHPDPSGRFEHRWWDGASWTKTVATNGMQGTDG